MVMIAVQLASGGLGGWRRDRDRAAAGARSSRGSTGSWAFTMIVINVQFAAGRLGGRGRDRPAGVRVRVVVIVVVVVVLPGSECARCGSDARRGHCLGYRGEGEEDDG